MPLYEYRCDGCQKVHEVMQKFSDAPLTECPVCQGPISKMISLSSFALKGSGWYTTDYKRAGSKPSESTPAAATSGETKPAAPAAASPAPAASPSTSSSSGSSTA